MRRKVCSKKCSSPENMQGKGQGSELRAQGSGLRAQGSGLRAQGLESLLAK